MYTGIDVIEGTCLYIINKLVVASHIFVSNSAMKGFNALFGYDFDNIQVKYNPIIANDVINKSDEEIADIVNP